MSNDRRRERQRHVRRLMRALTESEPILITETGDIQEQPRSILPGTFQELVAVRQQAYDALENQQREFLAQGSAGDLGDLGQRVYEAWTRTLEGVADRLDLGFWVGENEHMEHIIYETVMRLPDDVRAFVFDHVTFLSAAWGQAFRGRDWSYQIRVISRCSCGSWPPVKAGIGTDNLRLRLEREATLRLRILQCIQVLEVPIGQRLIGQRP
jgi:hypothetical protein